MPSFTPPSRRTHQFKRTLQVAVWLAAAALFAWRLIDLHQGALGGGIVGGDRIVHIDALEELVVAEIAVVPGQRVAQGDVVVVLGGDGIRPQIAAAEAQLAELRALEGEIAAALHGETAFEIWLDQARLDLDRRRRGQQDRAQIADLLRLRLDRAQLGAEQAAVDAELEVIADLISRDLPLVESGQLPRSLVDDRLRDRAALSARSDHLDSELTTIDERLSELEEVTTKDPEQPMANRPITGQELAAIRVARAQREVAVEIAAVERELAELVELHADRVYRSPLDGVVTSVSTNPGSHAVRGQRLVTLAPAEPNTVRIWVEQARAGGLAVDQNVHLRSSTGTTASGRIVSLDAGLDAPPEALLSQSGFSFASAPLRVRGAVVRLDEPVFVPGEWVELAAGGGWWDQLGLR